MGAEIGATTSLFPYDANMAALPEGHRPRGDRRRRRRGRRATCGPTPRSRPIPSGTSTRSSRSTSSTLEPLINGPHTPDLAHQVERGRRRRAGATAGRSRSRPRSIGSCTNSSYEDITRAASIARQAVGQGPHAPRRSCSSRPGSEQVRATIERDGLLADLEAIGAHRARQRVRPVHRPVGAHRPRPVDEVNTIVNSYNRNFPKRNDGNANTLAFVTSPDTVIALRARRHARLRPADRHAHQRRRRRGAARPAGRRGPARAGLRPRRDAASSRRRPTAPASSVVVDPTSDRLQLLEPFPAWDGNDYIDLPVLHEGQGQVHHRPHLGGRAVARSTAATSRTSRGNLFLGVDQRVHRRGRRGQGPARRRDPVVPRHRQALRARPGVALVRGRRRELRRGLVARARGDGAPVPQRQA